MSVRNVAVPWTAACGARVRERRQAMGLTQIELCQRIGRNNGTDVSMLESARRPISGATLVKLADTFGVSTDWLLCRDRQPDEHDLEAMLGSMGDVALRRLREHIETLETCRRLECERGRGLRDMTVRDVKRRGRPQLPSSRTSTLRVGS